MVKDLDDLLSAHHFLDEALCFAESLLLTDEEFCRIAADNFNDYHHQSYCAENNKGHPNAQIKHVSYKNDNCQCRLNKSRHRLRNKLSKSVNVVRVVGHYISVRMCIEVFYR